MFKKFPLFTVLATLVAWMLFWEVKETLSGERMFFVYRWLYSDLAHAKDIEVKTYLLTDEQVSYMFARPEEEIQQLSKKSISGKNINVVLRVASLRGGLSWGRLLWRMEGTGWKEVSGFEIRSTREEKKYGGIVIPLGVIAIKPDDSLPEPVEVKWKTLYEYL